jgi:hypothetical protein
MTEDWQRELVEEIETAFADTLPPEEQGFQTDGGLVTAGVAGKHWSEVEFSVLFWYRNEINFFRSEQIRFYLPAFLRIAVLRSSEVDTLYATLFYLLVGGEKKVATLAKNFTYQEKAAIASFVEAFPRISPYDWDGLPDKHRRRLQKAIQYWREASTFNLSSEGV